MCIIVHKLLSERYSFTKHNVNQYIYQNASPDQTPASCREGALLRGLLGWTVCTEQEGKAVDQTSHHLECRPLFQLLAHLTFICFLQVQEE